MPAQHVLFLCTGNSARSILAEALLNHYGHGRFVGHSAGSQPKGVVHPMALETLARHDVPAPGARSKSWHEFAGHDARELDAVVTVCDSAAGEACPIWPGHPATAHWGIPDPAAITEPGNRQRDAFERAYQTLEARIRVLTAIADADLDPAELAAVLRDIPGRVG